MRYLRHLSALHISPRWCVEAAFPRLVLLLVLVTLLGMPLAADSHAAPTGPTLEIDAPSQIEVRQPIVLEVRASHVTELAGYQLTLRYDPAVLDVAGLEQRQNDLRRF